MPKEYRYAFEFRDKAWYEDDVLRALAERNVALCISDHHDAPAPFEVTASHVYLRGHGPGGMYRGSYPNETLDRWAEYVAAWRRQWGNTIPRLGGAVVRQRAEVSASSPRRLRSA